MDNQNLKAAIWYLKNGMNVIPIKQDKKPYIEWAKFQTEQVTNDLANKWWIKWPGANIGCVTGKSSNMMTIDCDSQAGIDTVNEYLPDSFLTPTSRTPSGGQHMHFVYRPGLVNRSRVLTDTDVRTDGGYVILPPSKNGRGEYAWLPGLKISEIPLAPMPDMLFDILKQGGDTNASSSEHIYNKIRTNKERANTPNNLTESYKTLHFLTEGRRDNDLFHAANCLIKGGCELPYTEHILDILAKNSNPPFPENEIRLKIESVLKRSERRERNLKNEVLEWAHLTEGYWNLTEACKVLQILTREERKHLDVIIHRLKNEGIIEKFGDKAGVYRTINNACDSINFLQAETDPVDLWLPFNLHKLVEIMPGNIILLAGSPNAGKTGLVLNIIHANQNKFEIHYYNSEMGSGELKKRLILFDDMPLSSWNFKAYERSSNFADVIKSGPGKLNIIDYLELHENFYEVSKHLAEIHNKLKGAVAIVALQKNKGSDTGLGGFRSLEKPRLYLSMEAGTLKIVKAKNWKGGENPNGKQVLFKVVNGCKFIQTKGWHDPQS
jgi:hypothetical protein